MPAVKRTHEEDPDDEMLSNMFTHSVEITPSEKNKKKNKTENARYAQENEHVPEESADPLLPPRELLARMDPTVVNVVWRWYIAWYLRFNNVPTSSSPTLFLLRERRIRSKRRLQTLLDMRRFCRDRCKTSLKKRQVIKLWHLIASILTEDPELSERVYGIEPACIDTCPLQDPVYE